MEMKFKYTFLIFSIILISQIVCQTEEEKLNVTERIVVVGEKNQTEYKLPDEILEHYALYEGLDDYTNKTCSYESQFETYTEKRLEETIRRDNCIPNSKTLQLILDAGWKNLTEFLVNEIYLPKLIDPTNSIYTYLKKYESQSGKLKYLLADMTKYENLNVVYSYENYENEIKIFITLPDASFIGEYLSVYCYKDSLKINAIFKARNKFFRLVESKTLFDSIEGDCDYNYNSFDHKIEITLNKMNKLKKWTSLFK